MADILTNERVGTQSRHVSGRRGRERGERCVRTSAGRPASRKPSVPPLPLPPEARPGRQVLWHRSRLSRPVRTWPRGQVTRGWPRGRTVPARGHRAKRQEWVRGQWPGWSCICSHWSHDHGKTDGRSSSSWWGQNRPRAIRLGHASAAHRTEQSCLQGPVQGQNTACSFLRPLLRAACI